MVRRTGSPNAQRFELIGGGTDPIAVCRRTGRARMQHLSETDLHPLEGDAGAFGSEVAYADEPFRAQGGRHTPEMFVAGSVEAGSLGVREFVGRQIPSTFIGECKRAIVRDKMLFKEALGGVEALGE